MRVSYPLVPSAFDEIKEAENKKILDIEQKYEQIMAMIQQNPLLAHVKPEALKEENQKNRIDNNSNTIPWRNSLQEF